MREEFDQPSRRGFLKIMGGAAAAAAGLGSQAAEAQQKKNTPGAVPETLKKEAELPEHLELAKLFADRFLQMFSKFDKRAKPDKLLQMHGKEIEAAISAYFRAYAKSRNLVQMTYKVNLRALEYAISAVGVHPRKDLRAVDILNFFYQDTRDLESEDDSINRPMPLPPDPSAPQRTSAA